MSRLDRVVRFRASDSPLAPMDVTLSSTMASTSHRHHAPPPAPRVRHHPNSRVVFSSTAARPPRKSRPCVTPSSGPMHGRSFRLAREGVVPTTPSQRGVVATGQPRTGGKRLSRSGAASSSSGSSSSVSVPDGWTQRTKPTSTSAGGRPVVSFAQRGMHTVLGTTASSFLVVTNNDASAAVASHAGATVEVVLKAVTVTPSMPAGRSAFHIIVGFTPTSPPSFYSITGDVTNKRWLLERVTSGSRVSCVASMLDPSLKLNIFQTVTVSVAPDSSRDHLSVWVRGKPVFDNVAVAGGTLLGGVGVGAVNSKMVFKTFRVLPDSMGRVAGGAAATTTTTTHDAASAPPEGRQVGVTTGVVVLSGSVAPRPVGDQPIVRTRTGGSTTSASTTTAAPAAPATTRPKFTGDDPSLVAMIERDMLLESVGVTFDDIASLDDAKRLLNEAVVLPLLVPEFFTGIRTPWKGVMLFGPPGTGKTMLAKAVAGLSGTTFFNCSAATLVSKWRGESEKLVRCLFAMARHYAPSIIFMDEIDALGSSRGSSHEHEASRRLKAELLSQMDGVASATESTSNVIVLATSNTPWDLDEALRRRLEKRILVSLPDTASRRRMFELKLDGVPLEDGVDLDALADATDGYSGADVHVVCREACMAPMRRLLEHKSPMEVQRMRAAGELGTPTVSMPDLTAAIASTRPSVSGGEVARFKAWEAEFGAV